MGIHRIIVIRSLSFCFAVLILLTGNIVLTELEVKAEEELRPILSESLIASNVPAINPEDESGPLDPKKCGVLPFGSVRFACVTYGSFKFDGVVKFGSAVIQQFALYSKDNFRGFKGYIFGRIDRGLGWILDPEAKKICGCFRHADGGCFHPDTVIRLSDGSIKLAKDIAVGDELENAISGQSLRVTRVIESAEQSSLIEISTSNYVIRVSQTHPVYTPEGAKKANKLALTDEVMNEHGAYEQIVSLKALPKEYGQRVINFVLETPTDSDEDHLIVSDGLVTGDLALQLKLINQGK